MIPVWYNPATSQIEADWRGREMESVRHSDLQRSMNHRQPIMLRGIRGYVQKITPESGCLFSGVYCWNVRFAVTDPLPPGACTVCDVYIKTADVVKIA